MVQAVAGSSPVAHASSEAKSGRSSGNQGTDGERLLGIEGGRLSSGIDMALRLVKLIAGDEVAQAVQLSIEYAPQPPLDAGSPAKAPRPIVEVERQRGANAG